MRDHVRGARPLPRAPGSPRPPRKPLTHCQLRAEENVEVDFATGRAQGARARTRVVGAWSPGKKGDVVLIKNEPPPSRPLPKPYGHVALMPSAATCTRAGERPDGQVRAPAGRAEACQGPPGVRRDRRLPARPARAERGTRACTGNPSQVLDTRTPTPWTRLPQWKGGEARTRRGASAYLADAAFKVAGLRLRLTLLGQDG